MTRSFRHFDPGRRVIYGDDCLSQLPSELRRVDASRAMVVCGGTLSRSVPGLGSVREALGERFAGAFTSVAEQSPVATVEALAAEISRAGADCVVALGGGSAIVTARAASILHGEGRPAEELCTVLRPGQPPSSPRLAAPKLPQFAVPTTPTTAFAKSGAAVTGPDGRRLALFDPKARVGALFVHPALLRATPWRLMLDASLDAFAQGVQGLESSRREPLADAYLLQGVRLLVGGLPGARDVEGDAARRDLVLAAQLVGQGTDFTGAGLASALGHALGARCGVGNGHAKAVVLPHAMAFNAPSVEGRTGGLAEVLGVGTGGDAVAGCAAWLASLGLPNRLRDLGVARETLPLVAEDAAADWFLSQNPRPAAAEDVRAVLEAAW